METTNNKPHESLRLLYRFAERSAEVLERHRDIPQVAAFEGSLPDAAREYRTQYAALDIFERDARRLTAEAHAAIVALDRYLRSWVAPVALHLGSFDIRRRTNTLVAVEVLAEADGFRERLRFAIANGDASLDYAERLLDALEPLAEHARQAHQASQDALAELQDRRRRLHEAGVAFNRELVALRRVLRKVLDTSHRDYRSLRAPRTSKGEVDVADDVELTEPPPLSTQLADGGGNGFAHGPAE